MCRLGDGAGRDEPRRSADDNSPLFGTSSAQTSHAAIKAGKLHSTSAQAPVEIGRVAAQSVYDHFAGKPVEKNITVPVRLITGENAGE